MSRCIIEKDKTYEGVDVVPDTGWTVSGPGAHGEVGVFTCTADHGCEEV